MTDEQIFTEYERLVQERVKAMDENDYDNPVMEEFKKFFETNYQAIERGKVKRLPLLRAKLLAHLQEQGKI